VSLPTTIERDERGAFTVLCDKWVLRSSLTLAEARDLQRDCLKPEAWLDTMAGHDDIELFPDDSPHSN